MNAVSKQVHDLVAVELASANKMFPPFHSAHEGYAVILEEVEEAKATLETTEHEIGRLWRGVKNNAPKTWSDGILRTAKREAEALACEAIQVAAMCQKFMDMEDAK